MLKVFKALVKRDMTLAWRRRTDLLNAVLFFVMVSSLFPLAIGADPKLLRLIGPGVVWVGALLSCQLTLPRLFASDHADQTLEAMVLAPTPLSVLVLAKVLSHWLCANMPLVFIAPVLGMQFGLGPEALGVLALSLALGTPSLSLIGAIAGALTLGLRGAGMLVALLVLPSYCPVLIMGCLAVEATVSGLSPEPYLLLLAAFSLATVAIGPWAIATAIGIAYE